MKKQICLDGKKFSLAIGTSGNKVDAYFDECDNNGGDLADNGRKMSFDNLIAASYTPGAEPRVELETEDHIISLKTGDIVVLNGEPQIVLDENKQPILQDGQLQYQNTSNIMGEYNSAKQQVKEKNYFNNIAINDFFKSFNSKYYIQNRVTSQYFSSVDGIAINCESLPLVPRKEYKTREEAQKDLDLILGTNLSISLEFDIVPQIR